MVHPFLDDDDDYILLEDDQGASTAEYSWLKEIGTGTAGERETSGGTRAITLALALTATTRMNATLVGERFRPPSRPGVNIRRGDTHV